MSSHQVILLRHGESLWNQENRFTGWQDVDLAPQGEAEAREAGRTLQKLPFPLHRTHTSYLKRAIRTLHLALEEMDQLWLPEFKTWRLNERHYGALTGLNKAETAARHGEDQVKIWRRSFDVLPPLLKVDDPKHPSHDPKYSGIPKEELPAGESLATTLVRVEPYWQKEARPVLEQGQNLLIVAHGNSLRALMMNLEELSPEKIMEENIPTGIPLHYILKKNSSRACGFEVVHRSYLGDPARVEAAIAKVKGQGQSKK